MSKVLQTTFYETLFTNRVSFNLCEKFSSKLLQWQSAHLAIISGVRVFERAVWTHTYVSRRAAVTLSGRGNIIE